MHWRMTVGWIRSACLAVASTLLAGCSSTPITSQRIERAVGPTFANLVQVQVSWLGLPTMRASDFEVAADCRRLTTGSDAGSGEWACMLRWKAPDRRLLRDTYELFVTTDGCYTATVAAETVGGPTLVAESGKPVRNLLYAFEGCFDTT